MENLKERMIQIFLTFCMATTGGVFVCAVYDSIFWRDALLDRKVMWWILIVSFVCTLGNFIHPDREISKRGALFYYLLHYLYINVVILGGSYLFHCMNIENISMMAVLLLGILFVYVAMAFVSWGLCKRESKRLNQKLLEYQSSCERTEHAEAETNSNRMTAGMDGESNFTVDKQ